MPKAKRQPEPAAPIAAHIRATVALCTYERYDYLADAIRSLREQSVPSAEFDVIVVDNSPDRERSMREAEAYSAIENLRWFYEATPGLSNARNVAIQAAQGPVIAFLDDDAVASPDWLRSLLDAFAELGDTVAAVGGPVEPIWDAERPAWLPDSEIGLLTVLDLGQDVRVLKKREWLAGANVAYRVAALRQAGGFSVALGRVGAGLSLMSNDETELADRLAQAGHQLGYSPAARVQHHVSSSRLSRQWFRRRIAWQAVSEYVRSPEACFQTAEDNWRVAKRYMAHQSPVNRTIRGLALPVAEAGEFKLQMAAIYSAVIALLSGVEEPHDDL